MVCHNVGPGLVPENSMWELWYTNWHCDVFSSSTSVFSLSVLFHQWSILFSIIIILLLESQAWGSLGNSNTSLFHILSSTGRAVSFLFLFSLQSVCPYFAYPEDTPLGNQSCGFRGYYWKCLECGVLHVHSHITRSSIGSNKVAFPLLTKYSSNTSLGRIRYFLRRGVEFRCAQWLLMWGCIATVDHLTVTLRPKRSTRVSFHKSTLRMKWHVVAWRH